MMRTKLRSWGDDPHTGSKLMYIPSQSICDAVFSLTGPMAVFSQLRVVVYGHSYIHWAMKHALRTGWGRNLDLGTSIFNGKEIQWCLA